MLAPAQSLLGCLPMARKFAVLALMVAVPLAVALWSYTVVQNANSAFAQLKLQGTEVMTPR